MEQWHPESWRQYRLLQQPAYPDRDHLQTIVQELAELPPLVTPEEIALLQQRLQEAADGRRLILQAGDCAEPFRDCSANKIAAKVQLLEYLGLALAHESRLPVTLVGRMAGQYAKPRSADIETRDGQSLPCFRGELINDLPFDEASRMPDPARMLRGYGLASLTMNYIRATASPDLARLSERPWPFEGAPLSNRSLEKLEQLRQAMALTSHMGATRQASSADPVFTSHEALLLPYESALTRSVDGSWFNLSTHFPWVGMRTATPDSAHVEYLRGIANPVGIKVGTRMSVTWLRQILDRLCTRPGERLMVLIHRFGAEHIERCLPPLIETVKASGHNVMWLCDPMHGNTRRLPDGSKTRSLADIQDELRHAIDIHKSCGSWLSGLHLEVSPEPVNECMDNLSPSLAGRPRRYTSTVDPRLNPGQALEVVLDAGARLALADERNDRPQQDDRERPFC